MSIVCTTRELAGGVEKAINMEETSKGERLTEEVVVQLLKGLADTSESLLETMELARIYYVKAGK